MLQLLVAEPARAEGEKISEVMIRGDRRISKATILNVVKQKVGDTVSAEKSDTDIRAIFKLGHFQDVQASTAESDKGIVLVYTVVEKPVVSTIKFEGNKEFSTEKLTKEGLEISVNSVFSAKDLDRSTVKIKRMYLEKGYYLAEITTKVVDISQTEKEVTFNIAEGKKVLISTITFDGNKAFSDSEFKGNRLLFKGGVMETKESWFMSWLTDAGTYQEEVLKNDALLIADFYMNNGYINVKVGEPTVKLTEAKDALEVSIAITEGEQYRIGEIDFKGDLLEPVSVLRSKLKAEPGAVFNRSTMRTDISSLTDLYGDKGYAFANVVPLTKANSEKKIIDVTFDMEKGELVHIERISVSGNLKTRDKVVRREMRVNEGELYSATGLKRSKQNLMNTGFFEQANVATAKGSSDKKLNVNVNVKEKPTGSFTIGGGYSSLDGIVGQGSVRQDNFLGLGLKGNLSASLGGKSKLFSVGVTDPYFMDTRWMLGADIYRSERNYTDYTLRATGGNIKTGYPISDNVSTFFLYKYEIKDIVNPTYAYQTLSLREPDIYRLGSSTTSMVSASISHNNTDYRIDPSKGMINSLSVEFAGLGGNNKFARFVTDHTLFYPLYKNVIFSKKLTFGYISQVGNERIPIDERFYLGGIYSLRGFKARSVSPVDQSLITDYTGNQRSELVYLGGNKEFYGSFGIAVPLLQEAGIKGVVFFDYGNAYGESQQMFSSTLMSYGGGIRWASPLGPLRLEYGIPVNPRRGIDSSTGRLEFAIGSLF
jgi:outer membrane protein insertion porin family